MLLYNKDVACNIPKLELELELNSVYDIQKIAKIISATFLNEAAQPANITQLLFDSRKVSMPHGSLFFAIKGTRHDGHDYIENAYEKGVRNFVVSVLPLPIAIGTKGEFTLKASNIWADSPSRAGGDKEQNSPSKTGDKWNDANFLLVKNPLQALQTLAQYHRQQFDLSTIAITGSNGKTIIKEWLYELLREEHSIVRSPKSYNSQIGVPLSVWQINETHDLSIFEAGISQVGEMEKLANIIQPDIGLLTNIGEAHSEGFSSIEEKLKEKLQLFFSCKTMIYRNDNELINRVVGEATTKIADTSKVPAIYTWGRNESADLCIKKIEKKRSSTVLHANFKEKNIEIEVPFTDDAYLENIAHCWAVMLHLNYENETIKKRIKRLRSVPLRLELKAAVNNCTLINDSYNNDLNSLEIALDFLTQQGGNHESTLILSDILQTNQTPDELYMCVAELVKERKISRFIGVGNTIFSIKKYLPTQLQTIFYKTTNDLQNDFTNLQFNRENILLKGARVFEFERIAQMLEQKAHRTVLEINLNALTHNLNAYSRYLKPETKVMAMVKAAAYGSGSDEVARLLEFQNVDYFAVAYTDEGVELREAGIQLPILVLNPEAASFDTLIRHELEPEIYSLEILRNFAKEIDYQEITNYAIHLNLNTGMNRLGFEETDTEELIHFLNENESIKVVSIFSHLAGSDDAQFDNFSRQQITQFEFLYKKIKTKIGYAPMRHMLNSGGIVRFPDAQMDMVRLGIGLYGIGCAEIQNELETVSTLKATISQIKTMHKNDTIGYNRAGKASENMRIATISIGYADGFLRQLGSGRGSVVIHGKTARTVGSICMDMCMVDVTEIPKARVGEEVIIFGKEKRIQLLANELQTIVYEVFTNISGRVKRVYFQE